MTALEIGVIGRAAVLAAVLVAAPASAQGGGPAKLVVINQGVAITDYPSMARCEAARAYIAKLIAQKNAANEPRRLPGGGVMFDLPMSLQTFCIPG